MHPFKSIPAGVLLQGKISRTEDSNAIIIVEAIVVNGQSIKIQAQSDRIVSSKMAKSDRVENAKNNAAIGGAFAGLLSTALGGNVETILKTSAGGGLIGAAIGLLSPEEVRVIQIPANTLIILNVR